MAEIAGLDADIVKGALDGGDSALAIGVVRLGLRVAGALGLLVRLVLGHRVCVGAPDPAEVRPDAEPDVAGDAGVLGCLEVRERERGEPGEHVVVTVAVRTGIRVAGVAVIAPRLTAPWLVTWPGRDERRRARWLPARLAVQFALRRRGEEHRAQGR